MNPSDPHPAQAAEAELGAVIARLGPGPAPQWADGLGRALDTERRRRGLTARPSWLWLRAGCALALGVTLLLVALAHA